jgi:hypothetical protein
MTTKRIDREVETRDKSERLQQWAPAELLPEPVKIPGYKYHWVRISTLGAADPRNLSAKLREKWEPVPMEEQPEMQLLIDPNSRFKDNIEIGGLLLCKTPEEFVAQRNSFYAKQTDAQAEAVDNNLMRQSDSRMPLFTERKSTSSFGKG